MDSILEDYIFNDELPSLNYKMAEEYYNRGMYSSAISFFSRCKERTDNVELQYDCLIKISECFRFRGKSTWIIRDILISAINLLPKREEAYYLLSSILFKIENYRECYDYASLAIVNLNCDTSKFLLLKAKSSFKLGESDFRDCFKELFDNHYDKFNQTDKEEIVYHIAHYGLTENTQKHFCYDRSLLDRLRFKFNGVENIEVNYSQSYQDLFVLSMLNGKTNGSFLEIGGAYPYYGNNTALLEKDFGWSGVTLEIDEHHCLEFAKERKKTKVFCVDAKTVDYSKLISENFVEKTIDYLQLDIEPASNTLDVLKRIPFHQYKFRVITYEHDHYVDATKKCRDESREFLKSMGYIMVVNDISNDGVSTYEDWWVHPDCVDYNIVNTMRDVQIGVKNISDYMFTKKFYGEFYTDKWLREKFFPDYSYKGVFVDVGAGPPEFISNSKHFRDSGWRTVCVEPNPKFVKQHQDCRSEVYEFACSSEEKITSFVINSNNDNWYTEENDGVSFSALEVRYDGVPEHNTQETIEVNSITLNTLLYNTRVEHIDILSIDTEGWELDVLRGFNHRKYSPKVIVLENFQDDPSYDVYMTNIGYKKVLSLRYNHFYIKENLFWKSVSNSIR